MVLTERHEADIQFPAADQGLLFMDTQFIGGHGHIRELLVESWVNRREHMDSTPGREADGQASPLVGDHVANDAVGVLL